MVKSLSENFWNMQQYGGYNELSLICSKIFLCCWVSQFLVRKKWWDPLLFCGCQILVKKTGLIANFVENFIEYRELHHYQDPFEIFCVAFGKGTQLKQLPLSLKGMTEQEICSLNTLSHWSNFSSDVIWRKHTFKAVLKSSPRVEEKHFFSLFLPRVGLGDVLP